MAWNRKYKLTPEEYLELFNAQDGRCACCGLQETTIDHRTQLPRMLAIDHNHKTGEIRSLLCAACNISFGWMNEDPERIEKLLAYARKCKSEEQS